MDQESKLLIGAVKKAVAGAAVKMPDGVDWEAFLKLAHAHKLEGICYVGLKDQPLPEAVKTRLAGECHRAIFADTQLEHVKESLHRDLTAGGVPHVFLKGAVLKYDYPIPALRTMSDMDILVYTRDYDRIDAVCEALGGRLLEDSDGNHHNFKFPGGVTVEFHPNILHHSAPIGAEVNPGWQYVQENKMTEEGFYLTTLCHLADHFVTGGIGVRFVLDVWVFRNLRKLPMDREFVEKELERFGLLAFVKNIETLAQAWFGDGELTPTLEELGDYILTSGSHGLNDRAVLNGLTLSAGNKMAALWRKVFYPRGELEDRFPWCKGKPLLLPAAWCVRAFRAVTKRGDLILKWTKDTGSITDEEVETQRQMLRRFGIKTEDK